ISRARIWPPSKAPKFVWHTVDTRTLRLITVIMGPKLVVRSRRATREFLGTLQKGVLARRKAAIIDAAVKTITTIGYLSGYQWMGRHFKRKILDEFCSGCGYSRKHAIGQLDRKSTRLNSSHLGISYAVFFL